MAYPPLSLRYGTRRFHPIAARIGVRWAMEPKAHLAASGPSRVVPVSSASATSLFHPQKAINGNGTDCFQPKPMATWWVEKLIEWRRAKCRVLPHY